METEREATADDGDGAEGAGGRMAAPGSMIDRALDALHTDALVLADEADAAFGRGLLTDAASRLPGSVRVGLASEALKTTTRLMHVIAWLLEQRVPAAGTGAAPTLRTAPPADAGLIRHFPVAVADLVRASERLAARAGVLARLDDARGNRDAGPEGPARALQARLHARL